MLSFSSSNREGCFDYTLFPVSVSVITLISGRFLVLNQSFAILDIRVSHGDVGVDRRPFDCLVILEME